MSVLYTRTKLYNFMYEKYRPEQQKIEQENKIKIENGKLVGSVRKHKFLYEYVLNLRHNKTLANV